MAFFNDFMEKVNQAAQSVTNKTKEGMEISRLSGEGRSIQSELEGIYGQIGRAYVEANGATTEAMSALSARAAELLARLEELEHQKLQLRNQNACPACGAVMPKDARFCSNCGEKMPEPPVIELEPEIDASAPEEAAKPEAEESAEEPPIDTE